MDKLGSLFTKLKLINNNDHDKSWSQLKDSIRKHKLDIISLETPIFSNKVY
jgi:hypothetical protein